MGNTPGTFPVCGAKLPLDVLYELPCNVCLVDKACFKEVLETATRSFAGTQEAEPEWGLDWVLGPHLHGAWYDWRRHEVVRWLQHLLLRMTLNYGGVALAAKRPDGSIAAVCMTVPYISRKPPGDLRFLARYLRHFHELGLPPCSTSKSVLAGIGKGIEKRMDASGLQYSKMHKTHAPGAHWYVQVMAVDPSAQGQGFCRTLMEVVSTLADARDVPCYLEASGDRNVSIYERFGYQVDGQYTLSCEGDPDYAAPFDQVFAMVRPSRTAGRRG